MERSTDPAVAALDELFGAIDKYRTTRGFRELLDFLRRLPSVGPYNALLLHIQRPGATSVATVTGWRRLGREVRREAHPLVTLRPFGPVEFVYDVVDTTGPDLPADVVAPFRTTGALAPHVLPLTIKRAEHDGILVRRRRFGLALAGIVSAPVPQELRTSTDQPPPDLLVEINESLPTEAQYATLVHELAHIYCGHLGTTSRAWWKDRRALTTRQREFEAEAVTWIVCSRKSLDPGSYRYLQGFLQPDRNVPDASLNEIMVAANHIETIGARSFRPRKIDTERTITVRAGPLSVNTGEPYDEEREAENERIAASVIKRMESKRRRKGASP